MSEAQKPLDNMQLTNMVADILKRLIVLEDRITKLEKAKRLKT